VSQADEVLAFWFGDLDERGRADEAHTRRWYMKDATFDAEIARRFGALHGAVARGERDDWLATPRGRLAAVIVLDQFSRNMFRGSKEAFASDARAAAIALEGIERGEDRQLAAAERSFLYMPLMHAEDLALQERCVALFRSWCDEAPDEAAQSLRYAEQHRDIVARFGRFPHRNATLGRDTTPEEATFLTQPGSSF
jgi:uncharacterized protein (DUF924 family)